MRKTSSYLLVATLALSIVTISCGGGGDAMGGNSSTRLSDEAFCAKITPIIIGDDTSRQAMLDSLEVMKDLAKVAPTAELQEALEAYIPYFEKMSKLDQNDPEAIAAFFGDFSTRELLNAGEVLKTYGRRVCGMDN